MALPAGSGAFVRAAGGGCPVGARRGLLRRRLLQRPGASSSQTAASSVGGLGSDGLRARYERDDVLLNVLLQGPGATCADTGGIRVASVEFCSGGS